MSRRPVSRRFLLSAAIVTVLSAAGSASAQSKPPVRKPAVAPPKASSACPAIDTTATWFKRQREWLDERGAKWTDDGMRFALLGETGTTSNSALYGYEVHSPTVSRPSSADSTLIAGLLALAAQRGSTWPTKSVVGARGVLAVWGLAAQDTTLARAALKRMMEAGPDESPPAAVAILEDRQRVRAGRKQLYGTQLQRNAAGVLEPLPIEDMAHLTLRRDGAELPPLAQSVCAANAARPIPQR